jgi:holo-[acyl-carrier protein] synthase
MVVGVGIDIVEVDRIRKALQREKFARRVLTELEELYCTGSNGLSAQKVAGRWAAKEAVIKAVGIPFRMQDIEILNDPLGVPVVTIHDNMYDRKRLKIFVSITHERGHAAAVAVVERSIMQVPLG